MNTTAPRTVSEVIARADRLEEARTLLEAGQIDEAAAILDQVDAHDAAREPAPRPYTLEHCSQCDDLRRHTDGTCDGCGHTASIAPETKRMTAREVRAAIDAERTRRAKARGDYREPYDLDYLTSSI